MTEITPQQLHQLGQELDIHLGFEWQYLGLQHDRMIRLGGPDGCAVHLSPDWPDRSRLAISGAYPDEYRPWGDRCPKEVTAAYSKGAARIAKDITRRFFPSYHPVYLEMVEARRKAEKQHAQADRWLDELAGELDGHCQIGQYRDEGELGNRSYKASTPWSSDRPQLSLEISSYSQDIKIELDNLPLDLALRVCAMMRDELNGA